MLLLLLFKGRDHPKRRCMISQTTHSRLASCIKPRISNAPPPHHHQTHISATFINRSTLDTVVSTSSRLERVYCESLNNIRFLACERFFENIADARKVSTKKDARKRNKSALYHTPFVCRNEKKKKQKKKNERKRRGRDGTEGREPTAAAAWSSWVLGAVGQRAGATARA